MRTGWETAGRGRRAAAALLAVVVAFTAAGVSRCDAGGASSPAPRAQERGATNPPAGVPSVFTGQRLDWAVCPAPSGAQGDGEAPGEDYECATMKAPLDYARPGGGTIDVALIRKRATGPEEGRIGSLLLNFGGPGVSGVVTLPAVAGGYAVLGEAYDLVSFDPRGVGGTAPVLCGQDTYEGASACGGRSGRLLPYVGTSYTARDMELMRFLLGDERLHYFGVSYGTRLGGVYAHLFPRNVGRMVLEAPVDPVLDGFRSEVAGARAVQRAFDRFARHCAKTHDDCPTGSGPEQARQRVTALLDRLKEKPAPAGGGEDLDDSLAAHGIANHLDRGRDGWEPLVKALREVMERGRGDALLAEAYDHAPDSRARRTGARAGVTGVTGDNGTSALVAISCADSDLRPSFEEYDVMEREVAAASPVFGETWANALYLCYDWPFDGESAAADVRAAGAPPVLVVANTGDPTTPYEGARRMAAELGEGVGVLLTVRDEGHGSFPHNRCGARAVHLYLLHGTTPEAGAVCP
ncbi:alpha/beta hydrolase [Streptomyces pseudogriseolus]|uniref:alpha/beta hydrolase n=1 Tax=Streptomyces pseudogriseolus TaxID=36817 RepID=UPI003FA2587C